MTSDKRKQEILRQYLDGVKTDAIAVQFGVDSSYPGKLARRYGHPPRGRMLVSESIKAAIYADYCDSDLTIREIASKYGVSESYPTKLSKTRGGPRRYNGKSENTIKTVVDI